MCGGLRDFSSVALTVELDADKAVVTWGAAASDITGVSSESAVGHTFGEGFLSDEQRADLHRAFDVCLAAAGERTSQALAHFVGPRGDNQSLCLSFAPRRDADGAVNGLLVVGQDVSRALASTSLSRACLAADPDISPSQALLDLVDQALPDLVDSAEAVVFTLDEAGRVESWSRGAVELTGWTSEEVVHRDLGEALLRGAVPTVRAALAGNRTPRLELPVRTREGGQLLLLLSFTPRRGEHNQVNGVVCIGHPLTSPKASLPPAAAPAPLINEPAVELHTWQESAAADLARLIDSGQVLVLGIDRHMAITEWSCKAAALSGRTKAEVLGQPLEDFVHERSREEVRQALSRLLEDEEKADCFECPLVCNDGSEVFLSLGGTLRRNFAGEVVGLLLVGQDVTTLRQAMLEETNSVEDLRRIIDQVSAPIFSIDHHGCVNKWSLKMAEVSECSRNDMLGQVFIEQFVPEQCRENVHRVFTQILSGEETTSYELPINTRNGTLHFMFIVTARRDASGTITGLVGVGQDISKIQAVIRDKDRVADELSRLIENANAPIFGVDTNGLVNEWNRKASEITGYNKEEAVGQSLVRSFIHRVHQKKVQGMFSQALSGKEVGNFELTLHTRSGERREILLNATPRRGDKNEVLGAFCVGQEITELNKHRIRSDRIAYDLVQLIETANAPIFSTDKNLNIVEWNGWVALKSGWKKEEVRGKRLTNYILEDMHQVVLDVIEKASLGRSTSNFELKLKTWENDRPVCLLLSATPRLGVQGEVVGVIYAGQDITNIKDLDMKKSNFMATVSHELKSPIHGIIGLSSTLSTNPELPSTCHRPLTLIQGCAARLLDLVSNIIDVCTLTQEKTNINFSRDKVQLSTVIEEVVLMCRNSVDKRGVPVVKDGVTLTNSVADTLPIIEADKRRCSQLFYNLVTNACKFTQSGSVTILAARNDEEQFLTVTVEDTGIGIAPDNIECVFEPFDQEDTSEQRHYEGLGLGLSLCREVALKHGGDILVESVQGEGSKFHVKLPYKMADIGDVDQVPLTYSPRNTEWQQRGAERQMPNWRPQHKETFSHSGELLGIAEEAETSSSSEESEDEDSLPAGELKVTARSEGGLGVNTSGQKGSTLVVESIGFRTQDMLDSFMPLGEQQLSSGWPDLPDQIPTILTVDDDEANQTVMSTTFTMCNYKVVAVNDGNECLHYLNQCDTLPDVILLDLVMPGLSGLDVLSEVRKRHSIIQLPIIIVSAKNSTAAVAKGLRQQCNDWIHKPVDRSELVARVRNQIRIKEQIRISGALGVPLNVISKVLPTSIVEHLTESSGCLEEQLKQIALELRDHFSDEDQVHALEEQLQDARQETEQLRKQLRNTSAQGHVGQSSSSGHMSMQSSNKYTIPARPVMRGPLAADTRAAATDRSTDQTRISFKSFEPTDRSTDQTRISFKSFEPTDGWKSSADDVLNVPDEKDTPLRRCGTIDDWPQRPLFDMPQASPSGAPLHIGQSRSSGHVPQQSSSQHNSRQQPLLHGGPVATDVRRSWTDTVLPSMGERKSWHIAEDRDSRSMNVGMAGEAEVIATELAATTNLIADLGVGKVSSTEGVHGKELADSPSHASSEAGLLPRVPFVYSHGDLHRNPPPVAQVIDVGTASDESLKPQDFDRQQPYLQFSQAMHLLPYLERQNAHLMLQLRQRERGVAEAQVLIKHQAELIHSLQASCIVMEAKLVELSTARSGLFGPLPGLTWNSWAGVAGLPLRGQDF